MTETYYPPRARWYSSLWRWWYPLKRRLYLDRLPKFVPDPFHRGLLGLALPGWAFVWTGQRMLGWILGSAYSVSALVFLIWAGYPVSNFAFTVMISIHAGSILRIQEYIGFWKRIVYSLVIFLGLAGLVYIPVRSLIERHWFMPLRVQDRVIVIRTGSSPLLVQRGVWIAYQLERYSAYEMIVQRGCTLGCVLALPGDEVSFRPGDVLVNGQSLPRQAYMPTNGTIQIQRHSWFIWPRMDVRGAGGAEAAMMRLAIVPETSYVGVPYRRWFWREQTVP